MGLLRLSFLPKVLGGAAPFGGGTTPVVKETNDLEGTDRGTSGYGSTGVEAVKNQSDAKKKQKSRIDSKMNETPLSQSRRLITARQMSKIAKGDNLVFLAIVRKMNEAPPMKKLNKRSSGCAARFTAAHGLSEGSKRSINKREGPKKDIISVAKREQQVLDSVPVCHRENWVT